MHEKKEIARHLYLTQGMTQKQIATEVGVSERTIYTWIHQYSWDKLKQAAYQAPVTITESICSELAELQADIASREKGKRFPDPKEAETIRKLVIALEKLKKYPSLSLNMQVLETFKNFIRPIDKEFACKLADYMERFLSGKSVNGFTPYQQEYGVDQVSPVMSFYDELSEEEDPTGNYAPCPDMDTCPSPADCRWPRCNHSRQWWNETSPDPLTRNSVTPIPAITEEERRKDYDKYMEANGFRIIPLIAAPSSVPEATGSDPAN